MAASKDFLALDHSKIKVACHDGMMMPEYAEPLADHLRKVKAMEIRDDDIILCTFPKSGTHWISRVMDMLKKGEAKYSRQNPDSTFLDIQDIDAMKQLQSPRILVTHMPANLLPDQIKDKRTKLVHVYRNPRAVLVSYYNQMKSVKDEGILEERGEMTLDIAAGMFFSDKMPYTGWFKYMDALRTFKKENPDHPVLDMSYEEMSQNPAETVARLGEFLEGKAVSSQLCADIVEACSFNKQKAQEESMDASQAKMKFYRKGDMNDWKNYVTVALDEKFKKTLTERKECIYSAKY